jgi:hypothetical protein
MHDATTFAEEVLKRLRNDKQAIETACAVGNVPDWDAYQHLKGTYKGLALVESNILELLGNMAKADT